MYLTYASPATDALSMQFLSTVRGALPFPVYSLETEAQRWHNLIELTFVEL